MDDRELDALLHQALAPPSGAADPGFVAGVDRAVAEVERFRRWKAGLRRRLVSEGLTISALGGSLAFIVRAPPVGEALVAAPGLLWSAGLSLVLLWVMVRGRSGLLA